MDISINLLPHTSRKFLSQERLLLWSKIAAIVSVILVVCTSIFFFLLSRDGTIEQLKADQSRTLAQLTLLQDKTAKYLIIIDRVGKIKTIVKSRKSLDTHISTVLGQIPSNVSVSNITVDTKTISLSVTSSNLSDIGTVIDKLVALAKSKTVLKNLTIQGLITDEKAGTFVLSLSADTL